MGSGQREVSGDSSVQPGRGGYTSWAGPKLSGSLLGASTGVNGSFGKFIDQ